MHEFIKQAQQSEKALLLCHYGPDGDTLGSAFALAEWLQRQGITAVQACSDPVPELFARFPGVERIKLLSQVTVSDFDTVILVDVGTFARCGLPEGVDASVRTLCVDHHRTSEADCGHTYADVEAGATAELITSLYEAIGMTPSADAANWLYTGLLTDTGSFNYSNTRSYTLRCGAALIDAGADPEFVSREVFRTRTRARVQIMGKVLSTLTIDGTFAWMYVTDEMLNACGACEDDTTGFVNYALEVQGVSTAALFKDRGSCIRVSLRSKFDVDVSKVAARFGGGGHSKAAGCTFTCCMEDAVRQLTQALTEEEDR